MFQIVANGSSLSVVQDQPAAPSEGSLQLLAEDPPPPLEALTQYETENGMLVTRYALPLAEIPADFFADPDGSWTFDALAEAAGFALDAGVAIGALREPFNGHHDGAAVVTLNSESRPYIAIVECPIAYSCVAESHTSRASAA
jgi:hypothetical protein